MSSIKNYVLNIDKTKNQVYFAIWTPLINVFYEVYGNLAGIKWIMTLYTGLVSMIITRPWTRNGAILA